MVKAHCYEWEERFFLISARGQESEQPSYLTKREIFTSSRKNNDIARKTRIYYYFLNHWRSDSFHDEDESDRAMLIQRSSGARRRQKESTSKFKAPQKRYEPEWWKTFVVLIYLICCLFLMTVTETIVHDKVPGKFIYLKNGLAKRSFASKYQIFRFWREALLHANLFRKNHHFLITKSFL